MCIGRDAPQGSDYKISRPYESFMINRKKLKLNNYWLFEATDNYCQEKWSVRTYIHWLFQFIG